MSSNNITIGQITEMSAGGKENPTWINEEFEAVITNVTEKKTTSGKTYALAVLQDPHSTNISIEATFWMHGIPAKQGKVCHFAGQGMKLEEYKGNLKLVIGDKAKINVVGSAPAGAGKAQAPRSGAQQGAKPAAGAGTAKPGAIFGATVGMAVNQAIGLLKEKHGANTSDILMTSEGQKELHTLCSDILRVAAVLEKGVLAPAVKDRNPTPAPAPEPEPEPESEPEAQQQAPAADDGEDVPF